MKKLIFLCLMSVFVLEGCNYIRMKRHLTINIDDTKSFDQSGQIDKLYLLSTGNIINSLEKNINTKESVTIENLEIETLQLSIALLPNNTASSLHNIHIKLGKGWSGEGESLVKLDTSRIPVNQGLIYLANSYMIFKGVSAVKKSLTDFLVTKQGTLFELNMSGFVPAGQAFRGSIKLVLKTSFDAITCEKVPIGLGPSECMILPVSFKLAQ